VLYSFCSLPSCSEGALPQAGLIADSAGNLYGTTFFGGASSRRGVQAGGYGVRPVAGLIADSSGNLYGTTAGGGASGKGVVFKLTGTGSSRIVLDLLREPRF
jgi:uncharacterized repeat protein (TIGR03803 family)